MILFIKQSAAFFGHLFLYGCCVLLPLHFLVVQPSLKDTPPLTMDNLPNGSAFFMVHLVSVYLVTGLLMYHLSTFYRLYMQMRRFYFTQCEKRLFSRTCMVIGIPQEYRTNEALQTYFEKLEIGRVMSARVVPFVKDLEILLEERMKIMEELELACVHWAKRKSKTLTSAGTEHHPLLAAGDQARLVSRWSWFKFRHEYHDDVYALADAYRKLNNVVETMRQRQNYVPSSVGFVVFDNAQSSNIASQCLLHGDPFVMEASIAPEPQDLYDHLLR